MKLLREAWADVLTQWLAGHRGAEIVSRDRAGVYADGGAFGAPHDVQVADRLHLLPDLGNVAERVLAGPSIPPIPVEDTAPVKAVPPTPQAKEREIRKDAER